ncbi:MAG: hypothetical protein EOO38_12615 [Cytophagaceae bacterium]|nr:MAG: hypothetical protein EOO38_12615 [Cytophagaceae bacterium]
MRTAGVSVATLKRLERIEQSRSTVRPYARFPPILGLDEWEALAVPSQEALRNATRNNGGPVLTLVTYDEVTRRSRKNGEVLQGQTASERQAWLAFDGR